MNDLRINFEDFCAYNDYLIAAHFDERAWVVISKIINLTVSKMTAKRENIKIPTRL